LSTQVDNRPQAPKLRFQSPHRSTLRVGNSPQGRYNPARIQVIQERSCVISSHPLIGIPAATYADRKDSATPAYRFNGFYTDALAACGALPLVIPLNLPNGTLRAIFERLDGLCLSGGVDVDPAEYGEARRPDLGSVDRGRDETELALANWALEADLPVFGICRGIQLLNVAAGGSLYQHIPGQVRGALRHDYTHANSPWEQPVHEVVIEPASLLAGIVNEPAIMTNSFHHQSVKEIAKEFRRVAHTEDGVVEAIEHPQKRFVLAVQWHPEGMFRSDPHARRLFEAFVAACAQSQP
jgi:putative glutamine amidotransferase